MSCGGVGVGGTQPVEGGDDPRGQHVGASPRYCRRPAAPAVGDAAPPADGAVVGDGESVGARRATRASTSACAEAICSAPSRAATGGGDQAARRERAAGGDVAAVTAGRLGGRPGPEVAAAVRFARTTASTRACRSTAARVPVVGQSGAVRPVATPRPARRSAGSRPRKRSALRRSARSKASADIRAATAHPRMFAMTSVSLAAIEVGRRDGAGRRPWQLVDRHCRPTHFGDRCRRLR